MSTFQYKTHSIYYEVYEQEKADNTLVFLNGIMMSTASWSPFIDSLQKTHNVILFDMLDQGQSSKMSNQYTQEIQVEILYTLINNVKYNNISLVGISYGASVALQYATKYPDTISRMIIANAVSKTSSWLKAIGDGWNQVAKTRNGEAYYNITIPYIYSSQFYQKNIDWMEARKEILLPIFSNPEFLDAMTRLTISAETHDVNDTLRTIPTPTLIISSEEDYLTPPFEQEFIHKHLQDSQLIKIPECGHASMYEKPELFVSLIRGFCIHDQENIKI